jgi:hypothetical protein
MTCVITCLLCDEAQHITNVIYYLMELKLLQSHLLYDEAQHITNVIYYLMELNLLHMSFTL